MQNRKEYILEKAFEVFMTKGYDSASMTVLQKELKMSRGAMYRYFESKEDLFKEVIDRYFFGLIRDLKLNHQEEMTLPERIRQEHEQQQSVAIYLDNIDYMEVKFLNYTALAIQAAKRYPGFIEKLRKYRIETIDAWTKSIQLSIKTGEIRPDVNVKILAHLFAKTMSFINITPEKNESFSKGYKKNKNVLEYIYSLIKV